MLAKKDYLLVGIIGFFFGLFTLPILKNIKLAVLPVNFLNAVFIVVFFTLFAMIALWVAGLISKKISVVLQIAKFSAVGGLNTFLDLGILNGLIFLSGISFGYWYSLFKALSFVVASINSYFWNKHWTFGSGERASIKEFGQFFIVTLIGFGINVLSASLVVNVIGPTGGMSPERWANVGALSATIISLIWNFIGFKFIVFKKKQFE